MTGFIRFTTDALQQYNLSGICFFISSKGGDVDSGFALDKAIIHGIKAPVVPPGAVHLVMTFS